MKKIFCFFLTLLLMPVFYGCVSSDRGNLPVFDFYSVNNSFISDSFVWNNIVKKVTYVPIVTDELLGSAQLVYMDNEIFCIVDYKTNKILFTNNEGHVIQSFSHRGPGPGEYLNLGYVSYRSKDSTVCVFDPRGYKYIVYDIYGNCIQEFIVKNKKMGAPLFIFENFIVAKGNAEKSTCKLHVLDNSFEIRESLFPMDTGLVEMERMCLISQLCPCRNQDYAIVHFANEDTVFNLTEQGIQPICVLNKGSYKQSNSVAKAPITPTPEGSPYIRPMWLSSVLNYFLVTYMRENIIYDEIWDKKNMNIVSRFSNKNNEIGIPFILPSGKKIKVDSRFIYIRGDKVAFFVDSDVAVEGRGCYVNNDNPVLVVLDL